MAKGSRTPVRPPALKTQTAAVVDSTTHITPGQPSFPSPFSQQFQFQVRSGPIPTPQELMQYDQLSPGLADRIVAMAEREQAQRHNIEDLSTRADIRHRDEVVASQREAAQGVFRADLAGQIMGWSVGILCVCGAVYTALNGVHYAVSIALVSLPVASIIKAFRNGNGKEQAQQPSKANAKGSVARKRAPKISGGDS